LLVYPQLKRPDVWTEYNTDLIAGLVQLDWLETHDKFSVPLFGPYILKPNTKRANVNVQHITHLALDFDDLSDEQADITLRALSECLGVAWSTFSWPSDKPGWRFRAVLALTRPVAASEWKATFRRILTRFPHADQQCNDPSRAMFLPSCRPGAPRWRQVFTGEPIDPAVVATPPVAPNLTTFTAPIPHEILHRIQQKWWKSNDIKKATIASALRLAIDGAPFAREEDHNRNVTAFDLVCALVREIKNVSAEAIVATLKPSLDLMKEPTPEQVFQMVARAQEYQAAAHQAESASEQAAQASSTTLQPITLQYLSGMNFEDPIKALVFQRDADYWVFAPSDSEGFQYIACSAEGLTRQCQDKWGRLGVRLTYQDGDKVRKLKGSDIVETYGTPIESVLRSFEVQEPGMRRKGARRSLVLPAARRNVDYDPEFSVEVDHWLSLLGGDNANRLKDWLALACSTTRPLAALMMIGAPHTGKSLLAKEFARIWTEEGPPSFQRVLGDAAFNDDMLRCPVVLADEKLPGDNSGRVRSEEIRDFLQRGRHQINAKFKALVHLEGYPRLIGTANGDKILDLGSDNLTPEDLEAIQARLFVLRVRRAARDYLDSIDVGEWIENATITRHILWLEANHKVEYQGAYGIPVDATEATPLIVAQGLRSSVLEWLVKFLLKPNAAQIRAGIVDDRLAVRLSDLEHHWNVFSHARRPRIDRLASVSRIFPDSGEGLIVVRRRDLTDWVRAANYCPTAEVVTAFDAFAEAQRQGLSVVH
jgi:hypothetical protein